MLEFLKLTPNLEEDCIQMCGLVGVSSFKITQNEIKFFKQLLYADALRGHHSTGVAFAFINDSLDDNKKEPSKLKYKILKSAQSAGPFLSSSSVDKGFKDSSSNDLVAILGHNRWATMGEINHNSAHPFLAGDIILAHNGTLVDQTLLPDYEFFSVDSENIAHSISEIGVEETISKLDGAFALSWYNLKDKTLNFIRNNERPLSIFANKSNGDIFWCSEQEMGEWISSRCHVKYDEIWEPQPGQLYSFDLTNLQNSYDNVSITEVELHTRKHIISYNSFNNYQSQQNMNTNYKQYEDNDEDRLSLSQFGFSHTSRLDAFCDEFIPYKKSASGMGMILAEIYYPTCMSVEIHGTYLTDFDEYNPVTIKPLSIKVNSAIEWPILLANLDTPSIPNEPEPEDVGLIEYKDSDDSNEDTNSSNENNSGLPINYDDKKFVGPMGRLFSFKEMDLITRGGCSVCCDNIFEDQYEDVSFTPQGSPLCPACAKDWEM